MYDALVSPAVAGVAAIISTSFIAVAIHKTRQSADNHIIPIMGVTGAFILVAQMINFAIPGTGSSGHLIGAVLLSAILGPWAGFLVLSSVIILQCLLFADGGLLALGCNILNMGIFSCFVAYPLFFRPFVKRSSSFGRITLFSIITCVVGLMLGAVAVTIETTLSGITALPLDTFLLFMLPIHLVIGIAEGLATAGVLFFVQKNMPEMLPENNVQTQSSFSLLSKPILITLAILVILGLFAEQITSTLPDGLEWSILHTSTSEHLANFPGGIILGIAAISIIILLSFIIKQRQQ